MEKNIFLDKNQFVPKPKRNAYDLSKLVNGTYKQGFLYPIDFTEVTFGDSVKIDIRAALRTMPMVWPIQTPILIKFYSFYVRYRTLWDNYADFRFNNKQVAHPYISLPATDEFWKTGGLADHMGVPTTYFGEHPSRIIDSIKFSIDGVIPSDWPIMYSSSIVSNPIGTNFLPLLSYTLTSNYGIPIRIYGNLPSILSSDLVLSNIFTDFSDSKKRVSIYLLNSSNVIVAYSHTDLIVSTDSSPVLSRDTVFTTSDGTKSLKNILSTSGGTFKIAFFQNYNTSAVTFDTHTLSTMPTMKYSIPSGSYDISSGSITNPFSGNRPHVPISALPFRAYEACYRSYFQDLINEPFILNGEPQYNRYVTNKGDGLDPTQYHLFRRNWESDFLTSCKPTPQQGLAPIVGISSKGDITLVKGNGDEYTVHVNTDDNDIITSVDFATQSTESDSSVRRTLLELATSGITINALRNTNALQQWLESNYRRGLKLRDQVMSNFGVKLEYKELDMPEFLGGFTIPLDVNSVTQMSSSVSGHPLGELAGNGFAGGQNKHVISHYCDEEGCILTLMCITPIPIYTQILPRTFLKSSPLDYYNPQFGKIGNQPVTYEEVCPIQAINEGVPVTDVFGYQRPWYHLISAVDEAHGHFRDDMSGFLQQRVFGSTPELGADFLHIDQDQLTDVFVIDDETKADPFFGQIRINKFKKTAIPRFNLPSLN